MPICEYVYFDAESGVTSVLYPSMHQTQLMFINFPANTEGAVYSNNMEKLNERNGSDSNVWVRYVVENPDKSRCKPLPTSLSLNQAMRRNTTDLGQWPRGPRLSMGVRVPIEGPLDFGKFPFSGFPTVKELLTDADNILGSCWNVLQRWTI